MNTFASSFHTYYTALVQGSRVRMTIVVGSMLLVTGIALYVFMIGMATSYVSKRHVMDQAIRDTHTRIAYLEREFLTLQNTIHRSEIFALGYTEVRSTNFVSLNPEPTALALRTE
ncbi:MAG: hypothetical protein LRY41_02985 [Candidatus Pacebacteria bacterium]|nr:hypothetical protein [Candidatus Paceibacterota bacterium]MCD8507909.1 hypothetical protein [Candidatus Paceibacterota bacterium]MCD8528262.1 hypothetical protein [Candidatus Paceibacterota bacterium]MCD8563952.1 hypothetical protein [Candidatus Paceibacterota bacterium]